MCVDKLTKQTILENLNDNSKVFDINIFDNVTSTNLLAKDAAKEGAKEGYTIIANSQSQGRGRVGRSFFSPSDTGIYLSIVLKPFLNLKDTSFITTLAAVSVCEAIESITSKKSDIKWVNDVFIDNKKVCGILTEASLNSKNELEFVILGIGINVYKPKEGFPCDILKSAGYIFENEKTDIKNILCAKVLEKVWSYYKNLDKKEFINKYKERNLAVGKNITVIKNGHKIAAYCLGLNDDLHLKVKYENGEEDILSSGEISIKLK